MIYDYIIQVPLTPTFSGQLEDMFKLIVDDGGSSPTLEENHDSNGNFTGFTYGGQKGTALSGGENLVHFRLRERKTSAELITYLESAMSTPRPPITVHLIKSRDQILNTGTQENPVWEHEELASITKSDILSFFEIHTFDTQGNITNTRIAELTDTLSFSHYDGTPVITL